MVAVDLWTDCNIGLKRADGIKEMLEIW